MRFAAALFLLALLTLSACQTVQDRVSSSCREKPETCTDKETSQLVYESYIETCSKIYGFKKNTAAFKECMKIFVPSER